MIHKHNITYVAQHIIARTTQIRFCRYFCVQSFLTGHTVSDTQYHGHCTPCLDPHVTIYCVWCIHPCKYFIYICCDKITFLFEGTLDKPEYPSKIFQSSTPLFDNLVVNKLTAFSKSGLDHFIINKNFATTEWNNSPFFSLNFSASYLTSNIFCLLGMILTYWRPIQTF